MPKPDEFDVLLPAPALVTAQLAAQILERAGIPSRLHGRDIGVGDLGTEIHQQITRPALLVPKGSKDRALEALRTAGFAGM